MNMKHCRLRLPHRGAVTVEMALVLPALFLLVLGAIEITRISMVKHVVDNASYEACRAVIVPGATVAEAEAAANDLLAKFGLQSATVTVSPSPILETTSNVTVQVDLPASANALSLSRFTHGEIITASTTLVTER